MNISTANIEKEEIRADVAYPAWKRAEDIIGAIFGLIVFLPLAPFIIIAVKFEDPLSPVLVRLPRVSQGRIIHIYKFRNMIPNAHKMKDKLAHLNERTDGPFFKIKHDPRITPVGRVLRKFRLDELPQLINVLRGELSLVGPRPHEPKEVEKYPDKYKHIIEFRAGATGLSQVSGASSLPFLKELELDSHYVSKRSPLMDIKIIVKTLSILFTDPSAV